MIMELKKLINYIMTSLLYYKRNGKDRAYSLKKIINIFDKNINFNDIFEIAKYLEAQGYIKADYILGDVLIQLTTHGQIEFEEKFDDYITEIIDKITNEELYDGLDKIADKFIEETIKQSKEDILKLIEDIEKEIESSTENGNSRTYLNKLEIIKLTINDEPIQMEILASAINVLVNCKIVTHKIRELAAMLNLNI
jgi:hypothetical protein